jgi:hypothetical protein
MFKFKIILLVLLAAASAITSLIIHNHADADLRARVEISRQQSQQLADLRAKQHRLSDQPANTAAPPQVSRSAEIAKLRAEAEALQKQTNELAKQSQLHPALNSEHPVSKPESHSPEYWSQMRQAQGTKVEEAMRIALAMLSYAEDHQNQLPSGVDQVGPYLAKRNFTLSGTNQFEIIFPGSLDQLDGIPWTSIAAVRDTQTFLTPDGKPARVYGMMGGSGQTVTSDDNFQSWEAEHVISAPAH